MTLFQMRCYTSVTHPAVKKNLSLHTCFLMEDQKEQGGLKNFLLLLLDTFLLLVMARTVWIYIKTACLQPQPSLWGMRFCKSCVGVSHIFCFHASFYSSKLVELYTMLFGFATFSASKSSNQLNMYNLFSMLCLHPSFYSSKLVVLSSILLGFATFSTSKSSNYFNVYSFVQLLICSYFLEYINFFIFFTLMFYAFLFQY